MKITAYKLFRFIILITYVLLFSGACQPALAAWVRGDWDAFFSKTLYMGILTFYMGLLYCIAIHAESQEMSKKKP